MMRIARIHLRQHGFSLLELMIAVTLGLILLAGIERLYAISSRSYTTQSSVAAIQDSGRYAYSVLSENLRRAGYWGGNLDIEGTLGMRTPDGSCTAGDTSWGSMLAEPIFGLNDNRSTYQCVTKSDYYLKPYANLGSDILTVRYASALAVTGYGKEDDNRLFLRLAPFAGRLYRGSQQAEDENTDIMGADTTDHQLIAHAYYVGHAHDSKSSKRSCPQGNKIPALIRMALDETGLPQREELVTGIEDLQVQYGIDTNGDGSVNLYVDADQVPDLDSNGSPDWDQVTAARFWLLVRDECPEPGYRNRMTYTLGNQTYTPSDGFRRQVFSSTVALRNRR